MDPGIITKEQLYKLLHISKRKAKWMLDEGIIPCQNRGTKTHTYLIRMEDVRIYLARPDAERQRELPTGQFNAHPVRSRRKCENLPQRELREGETDDYMLCLEEEWAVLPDDLSVAQVVSLTGICEKKFCVGCKRENSLPSDSVGGIISRKRSWSNGTRRQGTLCEMTDPKCKLKKVPFGRLWV